MDDCHKQSVKIARIIVANDEFKDELRDFFWKYNTDHIEQSLNEAMKENGPKSAEDGDFGPMVDDAFLAMLDDDGEEGFTEDGYLINDDRGLMAALYCDADFCAFSEDWREDLINAL